MVNTHGPVPVQVLECQKEKTVNRLMDAVIETYNYKEGTGSINIDISFLCSVVDVSWFNAMFNHVLPAQRDLETNKVCLSGIYHGILSKHFHYHWGLGIFGALCSGSFS